MKYVETTIRKQHLPSVAFPVLEVRVAVVDSNNPHAKSSYDKMVSMPLDETNEDYAKSRMFDGLCKLLSEAERHIDGK